MPATSNSRFWGWILTAFLALTVVVLSNLALSRVRLQSDLTEDKRYTLPPAARELAAGLEDQFTVRVFLSSKLPSYLRHLPRVLSHRLDEFREASGGRIVYEFIDPVNDEGLMEEIAARGIQPLPLQDRSEGEVSLGTYWLSMEFSYLKGTEILHLKDLGQILLSPEALLSVLPYQVAARIVKLAHPEVKIGLSGEKKVPSPQLQGGFGSEPTEGLGEFKKGVQSHYPAFTPVALQTGAAIKDDISLVIVHRPEKLGERQVYELDQYLMRGGRLLILLDNYSLFDVDDPEGFSKGLQDNMIKVRSLDHGLGPWLANFGIDVHEGHVADKSHAVVTRIAPMPGPGGMMVLQQIEEPVPGVVLARELDAEGEPTGQFNPDSPVLAGVGRAAMVFPAPITLEDPAEIARKQPEAEVSSLLWTSDSAWIVSPDESGSVILRNDAPPLDAERGRFALAVGAHGEFRSFFADKEMPSRLTPDGNVMPEVPGTAPKLDRSAKPGQLWVLADSDFPTDFWSMFLDRRNTRVLPSEEGSAALRAMTAALVNILDAATLGDELIKIRRPTLRDRTIDKELAAERKDAVEWWAVAFAPLVLVVLGILRGIWRALATRVASHRARPEATLATLTEESTP
jgi:hypothetical protein